LHYKNSKNIDYIFISQVPFKKSASS